MLVDYVRVYQRSENRAAPTPERFPPLRLTGTTCYAESGMFPGSVKPCFVRAIRYFLATLAFEAAYRTRAFLPLENQFYLTGQQQVLVLGSSWWPGWSSRCGWNL